MSATPQQFSDGLLRFFIGAYFQPGTAFPAFLFLLLLIEEESPPDKPVILFRKTRYASGLLISSWLFSKLNAGALCALGALHQKAYWKEDIPKAFFVTHNCHLKMSSF